jgi:hypothetical protein
MWLLTGDALNGKTRWLRPGRTYSVGRGKSGKLATNLEALDIIEDKWSATWRIGW